MLQLVALGLLGNSALKYAVLVLWASLQGKPLWVHKHYIFKKKLQQQMKRLTCQFVHLIPCKKNYTTLTTHGKEVP
jgi:hypothetical protein